MSDLDRLHQRLAPPRLNEIKRFREVGVSPEALTKLLRTYTMQTEALAKLKRGGEQTVRVEHVHALRRGRRVGSALNSLTRSRRTFSRTFIFVVPNSWPSPEEDRRPRLASHRKQRR